MVTPFTTSSANTSTPLLFILVGHPYMFFSHDNDSQADKVCVSLSLVILSEELHLLSDTFN